MNKKTTKNHLIKIFNLNLKKDSVDLNVENVVVFESFPLVENIDSFISTFRK